MKKLKIITVFLLTVSTIFITGCWNYREIESLSIVAGIGIDKSEKQKYHLTFDLVDMTGGGTSSGSEGANPATTTIETDGRTLFEAIRNATKECGKRLFFSDCKIIVISSDLARDGIEPIVDFFSRDAEIQRNVMIFVSQEKTAEEIFKTKPVANTIVGYELEIMIDSDQKNLSKNMPRRLYEVNNIIKSEGISLTIPVVKRSAANPETTQIGGTAIFKKDKLIGYIDNDDTQFIRIINNDAKDGPLVLDKKENGNGIALELYSIKTSVKPVISNGEIKMEINIAAKANLAENETNKDYCSEEGIEKVQKMGEETIKNHCSRMIKTVQEQYDTDIFGFGQLIKNKNKDAWDELKADWDQKFKTVKYAINPKVEIVSSATIKSKAKVGN